MAARFSSSTCSSMKVFYVRHGESEYNSGGFGKHLPYFGEAYRDAPLTAKGVEQAKAVAKHIEAILSEQHGGSIPEELEDLVQADCIISSPLTRALQTCLVAMGPLLKRRPELFVALDPDTRESVDGVHWDAVGEAIGNGIKARAVEGLQNVTGDAALVAQAEQVVVDASIAMDKWWSDAKDSEHEIQQRVKESLQKLQAHQCCRAVVVSHSGFIRDAFKNLWTPEPTSYIPSWFRGDFAAWKEAVQDPIHPAAAQPPDHLTSHKLENLGIVSVVVGDSFDFARPRLLFDTRILEIKDKLCADGKGWRLSENGQGGVKTKNYCACHWGLRCKGSQCLVDMEGWRYPYAENVFWKFCEKCKCA